MKHINPYLTFNGNCEQVFNFYNSVFNIQNYIITVIIGGLVSGLLFSAIISIFIESKR